MFYKNRTFLNYMMVTATCWFVLCTNSYKANGKSTILTLGIRCDKFWYHLKITFFVQKTFLLNQKNVFPSEKLILKSEKKSKIRYDFHCFWEVDWVFLFWKFIKSLKKHYVLHQNLHLTKAEFDAVVIHVVQTTKNACSKTSIKRICFYQIDHWTWKCNQINACLKMIIL